VLVVGGVGGDGGDGGGVGGGVGAGVAGQSPFDEHDLLQSVEQRPPVPPDG